MRQKIKEEKRKCLPSAIHGLNLVTKEPVINLPIRVSAPPWPLPDWMCVLSIPYHTQSWSQTLQMLFFSSFPLRFVKLRGPSFVTSSLSPTVRSFVCGFLYILFVFFGPTYLTMVRFVTSLLALSATAWAATSCSSSSQCPKDKPCCSRESASYMRPDQWLIHLARVWRMWYGRLLFGWM